MNYDNSFPMKKNFNRNFYNRNALKGQNGLFITPKFTDLTFKKTYNSNNFSNNPLKSQFRANLQNIWVNNGSNNRAYMRKVNTPNLYPEEKISQNLHFKKIKNRKKRKLSNSDFLKSKPSRSFFNRVNPKRVLNENNLFSINEKEELKFENRLINSFTQKIGYQEYFPSDEYFRNIPYTSHSQIPESLPMPYPRFNPVGFPENYNFADYSQNLLGKRDSSAFNPSIPIHYTFNQFNNTYFHNNRPIQNIREYQPKSNFYENNDFLIRKNVLSNMSSDSENGHYMQSNSYSSARPEHGQNESSGSSLDKKCSNEKSTHFNTETIGNVILPNEKFQIDNILKNSFLRNLNSTHQKCNFANSIQEVLSNFTKNESIEITKDNILILLNLQIPINKAIFDSIDIKYRIRIIALLFVKYVNKSAFANVCKPFMEDIDFLKDSQLSKFLKR